MAGLIYPDPYERQSFGAGTLEEDPFLSGLSKSWADVIYGNHGPVVPGGSTRISHRKIEQVLQSTNSVNHARGHYLSDPVSYVYTPALFFPRLSGFYRSSQEIFCYVWEPEQIGSWESGSVCLYGNTCGNLGGYHGAREVTIHLVRVPFLTRKGWQETMSNPDKLIRRECSVYALITQTVSVDDPVLQMVSLEDGALKRFIDYFSRPYFHPAQDQEEP